MGNKQTPNVSKFNNYKHVDVDSSHSALPPGTTLNGGISNSGHLSSINSTRTSGSFSSDIHQTHRGSFTASGSQTPTITLSSCNYPDLPPLQNRIDQDIILLIIMYMDILSRLQISICCKYFNKIILSEKCLSDVWIIHGLTHKKNTLWEVPIPNTQRYRRKIRNHHHQHQLLKTKSISALAPPARINSYAPSKAPQSKKKKRHTRASSYSFSAGISSKTKKINIMGGRNKKRRQSEFYQNNNNNMRQQSLPRSLPPEKIFGIEDVKDSEDMMEEKTNNNKEKIVNKDDSSTISGKNLIISTEKDHGIVIMQQHHRRTASKSTPNVISINLRNNNNNIQYQNNFPSNKGKKKRRRRHFFHELSEFNVVVADFKKYLLQFSPIIKYSRCLVVGADGLPTTLRDFSKLRWIPTVMTIEYMVLERNNDSIACEILNSFAHSLKYLSIRGEIDESLDLYDLNIFALRICMNLNQPQCEYLWPQLPSSLKYLCLFKTTFNGLLLNKSFSYKSNLYKNLLHLSLIDCTMQSNNNNTKLVLPPSLISLHLKNFQGELDCTQCQRLWEVVIHVDMKGYNQTQGNVINIAKLMESLEVCAQNIQQIAFYEYNNYDELVLPSQLLFVDWKSVDHLVVVVPLNWLNDEQFKLKFESATFSNIKRDIVYYYDERKEPFIITHDDDEEDEKGLLSFNESEKIFRKELRQRVGYSMFADFYNNHHVGEFNLSKFVRNGHHQLARNQQQHHLQ